jgi:hypothetical protein
MRVGMGRRRGGGRNGDGGRDESAVALSCMLAV